MKELSRDELIAMIQNNLLSAKLARAERELEHVQRERTEERARFDELTAKQASEFQRLSDRFQRQASEYSAEFERLIAERDEFAYRVAELTDTVKALRADSEYFRQRANQLQERVNSGGPVQAMADGAVEKAVDAYHSYLGKNKVGMIIALRKETSLGLVEAKSICLQIIAAIEAAKEATD